MTAEERRLVRLLGRFTRYFTVVNGHREYQWTRAVYVALNNRALAPLAARGWLEQRTESRALEWRLTAAGEAAYCMWIGGVH